MRLSRREFLEVSAAAAIQRSDARLPGVVPFEGGLDVPLGRRIGRGLDTRLFTDLSRVDASRLVTPAADFFVRTGPPDRLPDIGPWTIDVHGIGVKRVSLAATDLIERTRRMGTFLMECAGNNNPRDFGLMSVARWSGVSVADALAGAGIGPDRSHGKRILVGGFDHAEGSSTSAAGASWIFAVPDLERAFLATAMNDEPLTPDHGAPVRLIVPRWYGCACIKWVNTIELVPDDVAATSQMTEFATRTHQPRNARLARDFTPATIELAATPVRVERWLRNGRLSYRVVGIVWGGSRPSNALQIRFDVREPWVPVENCPLPQTTDAWSLWTHTWIPQRTGRFQIVLRVVDPSVAARRLDLYFYTREVRIDEI